MKTAIALSAIALGAAVTLQGAAASDKGRDASLTKASQDYDLSAAKKKRVRSYVHVYPGHYGYYYPQAFAPGDPSWQSPELIRRRAIGECVIDLGYGRYENCDGGIR
jgi:hypothetical protein